MKLEACFIALYSRLLAIQEHELGECDCRTTVVGPLPQSLTVHFELPHPEIYARIVKSMHYHTPSFHKIFSAPLEDPMVSDVGWLQGWNLPHRKTDCECHVPERNPAVGWHW